jgi:hypothetical protein
MMPSRSSYKQFFLTGSVTGLVLGTALPAVVIGVAIARVTAGQASTKNLHTPELDAGFRLLYELKFSEARAQFEALQKSHPQDPLGYASGAASYLFEECYRQGVLTSDFFLDDKRFLGKIPLKPNPQLRAAFFASDKQTQDLAQLRLKTNPDDPNALFAMSLSLGMQADYASLIDKHQLDSLRKSRYLLEEVAEGCPRRRRCLPWLGYGELHHRESARDEEAFSRVRWNPWGQEERNRATRDRCQIRPLPSTVRKDFAGANCAA